MLMAGDFIKEELLGSLFPDFCQKKKNVFLLSDFQSCTSLVLFSNLLSPLGYVSLRFRKESYFSVKSYFSAFLLHNFHCYKFMCPAAKLCKFKNNFI